MKLISIVTNCYNEELNVKYMYQNVKKIFQNPPLGNLIIYKINSNDLKIYGNRHSIYIFTRKKRNKKRKPIMERLILKYFKNFKKIPGLISWKL